jgi:hypothetical protein
VKSHAEHPLTLYRFAYWPYLLASCKCTQAFFAHLCLVYMPLVHPFWSPQVRLPPLFRLQPIW